MGIYILCSNCASLTLLCVTCSIYISKIPAQDSKCDFATSPNSCCDGYQWRNSLNRCIQCPSGFFGAYCELPCRYPSYGKDCQMECKCDEILCNHTAGCGNLEEVNITSDNVDNSSLLQKETKIKIMYISSNITSVAGKEKNILSTWTDMDMKHKSMLIGVIVFAVFFFAIICIYIKKTANKRASVHYYHCQKRQSEERNDLNKTSYLRMDVPSETTGL